MQKIRVQKRKSRPAATKYEASLEEVQEMLRRAKRTKK